MKNTDYRTPSDTQIKVWAGDIEEAEERAKEKKIIPAEHYRTLDVIEPKGIVQVYNERWWWCVDGNPEKAIFYTGSNKRNYPGSPQCNGNKTITERIIPNVQDAQLVFVPRAFVPWVDD